ncbi:MAG: nicotinate-nicotinamide nucleotide adenylyltransferase [Deltaproteobacteria bacterium]|nr:nicotinate-nicotinamide nucleotide adenylyltransferase [Deltaproteobacteria bacterium]
MERLLIAGILGGTFDPPHVGHLALARIALASGLVDRAWLVPCLRHPLGKEPAPFEDRVAMCRLLVQGEPAMDVLEIEREIDGPGRTLDLVNALRAAHPNVALRLLAGSDIWHERHLWHRYDEVARLAPPIFVRREGAPPIAEPCLDAPPLVSSSELRAILARGERPAGLAPEPVLAYIEAHGLYGCKP